MMRWLIHSSVAAVAVVALAVAPIALGADDAAPEAKGPPGFVPESEYDGAIGSPESTHVWRGVYWNTGAFPHHVAKGDFNGDGIVDLVIPNAGGRSMTVLLGDGQGGYLPPAQYMCGQGPSWVDTADVDGDGIIDVITANTGAGSLTVFYGD